MPYDPNTGAYIPTTGATTTAGGTQAQPTQPTQPTMPAVQPVSYTPGQQFSFNAQQYIPQYQQQAASIYDPQRAQIEALAQITAKQNEQQRIVTREDFAKRMQNEIEAINQRGAFFGGGALDRQSQVSQDETRALETINLQQSAANAQTQGQLAEIANNQRQYVQDQLSNAQTSAYNQWKDAYSMWADEQARKRQSKLDKEEKKRYKSEKKASKKAADRQYKLDVAKQNETIIKSKEKKAKAKKKKNNRKTL